MGPLLGIITLILFTAAHAAPDVPMDRKCKTSETTYNGQYIETIKLHHSSKTHFTWQEVRGTSNITVQVTHDLQLSHQFKDDAIVLKVSPTSGSGAYQLQNQNDLVTTLLIFAGFYLLNRRMAVWMTVAILFSLSVRGIDTPCKQPKIHLKVPMAFVKQICVNNDKKCIPVTCELSFSPTEKYSNVPSNNKYLFRDQFCTLKKPDYWDEWTMEHFGKNSTSEEFFFADFDQDGLVNILEYYGNTSFLNYSSSFQNVKRKRRSNEGVNVKLIGTDPTNPDTDGDLLLDGFEYSNSMSALKQNDRNADDDGDGLSNIDEQIQKTDPLNPDTDGDGVSDGVEISNEANPNDPSDGGKKDQSLHTAKLRLTIGDHSGSHSERYIINVGSISHQSPGYGLVGSGTYVFKPGSYRITVQWVGSKLRIPDFDYYANLQKISGKARVTVTDASRLLGYHDESSYDYAKGKYATLLVEANCASVQNRECGCLKTCESCSTNASCVWSKTFCKEKGRRVVGVKDSIKTFFSCPCKRCQQWYEKEVQDLGWLQELNREFKCPCRVSTHLFSFKKLRYTYMKPIDNPSGKIWGPDFACLGAYLPLCSVFHTGAYGCIRSETTTSAGARQQCCYDSSGNLIRPGSRGAGTPDRGGDVKTHKVEDVEPFNWCCMLCWKKGYCDKYISGVRRGDASHCS